MSNSIDQHVSIDSILLRSKLRTGVLLVLFWLTLLVGCAVFLWHWSRTEKLLTQSLATADLSLLFIGWLSMVAGVLILGNRWRALLGSRSKLSGGTLGLCLMSALLLNHAAPGPMGDFAAAWLVHKRSQASLAFSLSTSLIARLLGLLTAAIGALLSWWWLPESGLQLKWLLVLGLLSISLGVLFLFVLIWAPKRAQKIFMLIPERFREPLDKVLCSIEEVSSGFVAAILWSVIGHGFAFLGVHLSLCSLGASPNPVAILFCYLVSTCAGAVAMALPGSQLIWDAGFAGLLVLVAGYEPGTAMIGAAMLRAMQLTMMLAGAGALGWLIGPSRETSV